MTAATERELLDDAEQRVMEAMLAILQTSGSVRLADLLERAERMTGVRLEAQHVIKMLGWKEDDIIIQGRNFEPVIKEVAR